MSWPLVSLPQGTYTHGCVLKPIVDLTLALHFTHWCVCDPGEVSTGFHVTRDLFRSLWTERLPANTHLNTEVWPQTHAPPLWHLCESSVLFLGRWVIWQEGLSDGCLASFPCLFYGHPWCAGNGDVKLYPSWKSKNSSLPGLHLRYATEICSVNLIE